MIRRTAASLLTVLCLGLLGGPARAEVTFRYNGLIESDLRFAVPGKDGPEGVPDVRFIRSDNTARFTGKLDVGWDVRGVADVQVIFTGRSAADTGPELILREAIDPLRFESDALFVEVLDLFTEGLDLRLGRQILQWGTGDQFNPTSNLNPLDLEDRIKFGERIANEMVVLSYTPPVSIEGEEVAILDEINITLAAVPYFRQAQLPSSALLAFSDRTQFNRLVDSPKLKPLLDQEASFLSQGGEVFYDIQVDTPDVTFENMQYGARLSWALVGMDMSVSYYHGFNDLPRAERVYASDLHLPVVPKTADLTGMDLAGVSITNDVHLSYARKDVIGADFSTSLDFLDGLGLWAEFAWTFHDDLYRFTRTSAVYVPSSKGEALLPGLENRILERELEEGGFWKLVAGMDYTIASWWYVNVQYLHGFPDEFGQAALKDYFVAGSDFKMFRDQMLLRLFAIVQVQDQSTVLYPQLTFGFWPNTELIAGALLYTGDADSKFGNRLTGANTVFVKGRLYF